MAEVVDVDVTVDKWRFIRRGDVIALHFDGEHVAANDSMRQEAAVEAFAMRIQQLEGFIEADPLEREDHP